MVPSSSSSGMALMGFLASPSMALTNWSLMSRRSPIFAASSKAIVTGLRYNSWASGLIRRMLASVAVSER